MIRVLRIYLFSIIFYLGIEIFSMSDLKFLLVIVILFEKHNKFMLQ
jgi:hypothetical protein